MGITPEMRTWAEAWKKAGPALEAMKEEEWRTLDYDLIVAEVVEFDEYLAQEFPPADTSGLVIFQQRLRKRFAHE